MVVGFFSYWYVKYDRIIEQRFRGPVFASSAKIYAAPRVVRAGSPISTREIAAELRRAGYSENTSDSPLGSYRVHGGSIEILPGPESYHSPEGATITVSDGKVVSINSRSAGELAAYELEPQLVTSLFDAEQRSKRSLVTYDAIPKVMVDAVTAIEDRRFFQHGGVNYFRLVEAAWVDFTHQRHQQGGSTITMQLSRAFFLSPEKTLKRKLIEMLIAVELEHKFSKQQIFEFYANRVDLGQRGSFAISGFAEGSRSYFNKDLKDITLPEAALLAGLIQAPSYLSPYRHPERALERRNTVIEAMVETRAIRRAEADKAKAAPLKLAPPNVEASDAPYFVDMVRDTVISKLNEREINEQSYRIYTTLDPELQRAAAQAVELGIKLVDEQVTRMRTRKTKVGKNKFETTVAPGPFEFYANRVDLGQRGSFAISGLAEGSRSYFNKDLKDITLPEAALLAGLIQAPSYLSPYRHPERALERRNTVIEAMVETRAITRAEADKAKAAPLKLAPPNVEASDAPYFVDMVRDTVIGKLNEREINEQAYRIYTTLDPELQRAAAQAVEMGIKLVDDQVTRMRTRKTKVGKNKFETTVAPGPQAQVALVAMDPHTGEIRALVGGRNYGMSQLNHALARRPTGSIFKPFVYAAAMNTAVDGSATVLTPASIVSDQPSTFTYGDQIYEPRNYKEEYHGDVTLRYALALSLNNATVKVAEEAGYDKVAELAKSAGIASVKATPAMALGAYDATPVDMTAAYTAFANQGVRLSPVFVNSVRNARGDVIMNFATERKPVLDPRVAYVMTTMMEGVLNFGTAAGVRGPGLQRAGRRQDRQLARRLVCRLHLQPALHCLDRLRRL